MTQAKTVFLYRYGPAALLDNYVRILTRVGLCPCVSGDAARAGGCSALLLPGGGDSDPALYGQKNIACRNIDRGRDEAELFLVRRFAAAGRPILGICRGHQLLNIAFGGDLVQELSTKEQHTQCKGRDRFHDTVIRRGSLLSRLYGGAARVTSAHHQAIGRLGEGLRAIQWAQDGTIEAVVHKRRPILGLQWHPERQAFSERPADACDGAELFYQWKTWCGG